MSDTRYVKEVVISDPDKTKVILDNGDELGGIIELVGNAEIDTPGKVTIVCYVFNRGSSVNE